MSGKKDDGGKPPLWQGMLAYFPRALELVARVSAFGAAKYGVPYMDENWRRVSNGADRYTDALLRHLSLEAMGYAYDPESRLMHAAHVAWDALARLELLLEECEGECLDY